MKDVFKRTYLRIIKQGVNHGPADNDLIVSIVKEIKGQDYKFPQFMLDELLWDHYITEAWNDYVEAKENGENQENVNQYLLDLKDQVEVWLEDHQSEFLEQDEDEELYGKEDDNEIVDVNVKEFEAAFKDWKPLGKFELSDEGWEDEERYFTWQDDMYNYVSVSLQKDNEMRTNTETIEDLFDAGNYDGVKQYIEQRFKQGDF